jgi:hypothetical protein
LVVFQEVLSTNQHLVSNYLIAYLAAGGKFPLVAWVFEPSTSGMLMAINGPLFLFPKGYAPEIYCFIQEGSECYILSFRKWRTLVAS